MHGVRFKGEREWERKSARERERERERERKREHHADEVLGAIPSGSKGRY